MEHVFTPGQQDIIENSVSALRRLSPSNTRNISFRSTNSNTWWLRNQEAHQHVIKVSNILINPLSQKNKNQIKSSFMMIRNVPSITKINPNTGKSYINNQTMHINFETHPTYGEAFMQIIYYIDTPRYTNGRVASPGNRGRLLISSQKNGNTRILTPERGRAVYFTPTDTYHEVLPQSNSNQNVNVDRKMIIMMLYKPTTRTNVVARQIRNYNPMFHRGIRVVSGYTQRPSRNRPTPNSLMMMMSSLGFQPKPILKRKRNNNNNNKQPTKRIKSH